MILPNGLFILNDYQAIPEKFREALFLRLFLFPVLALITSRSLRFKPLGFGRGVAIILLAGAAVSISYYLYNGSREILAVNMVASLLLVLLGTTILLRLRWRYSLFCALACMSTSVGFLLMNSSLPVTDRIQLGTIMACMASLMLFASYIHEKDERLTYLLRRDYDLNAKALIQLNRKLEALSTLDGLTGVANRIAFDSRLAVLWQDLTRAPSQLSVIMIDIDHFKFVNDTQGHLYGDEVIKRVAMLIQECLRGPDDFLARFGGEEFVVLLPGKDMAAARTVAERICRVVQLAGSPAPAHPVPHPDVGLWTTVSCGVAVTDHAEGLSSEMLLEAADNALYRAKTEGRNRVCCALVSGITTSEERDHVRLPIQS